MLEVLAYARENVIDFAFPVSDFVPDLIWDLLWEAGESGGIMSIIVSALWGAATTQVRLMESLSY